MSRIARSLALATGLLLSLLGLVPASAQTGEVHRVVSLNPCLDEILLAVADRSQIGAFSHYARDPRSSTIAVEAQSFPVTFESAEEVIALRPDLVLASEHTAPETRAALARFGIKVETFAVADTIADNLTQIVQIATSVGFPERGEALIGRINRALEDSAPPVGAVSISALVFQPHGLAAGAGTLMDELLARTGFQNAASRYGIEQWGNVALEDLLANPPRVILSTPVTQGAPNWGDRVVSHPALRRLAGRMSQFAFPEVLLYCGGPNLIRAVEVLATARRAMAAPA